MTKIYKVLCAALWIMVSGHVAFSQGSYITGDFHQHTTYTDGSYTIGHMMKKNNQFGLDWWANSEHGGGFTTNARVTGKDNNNTTAFWDSYSPNPIIGTSVMSGGHQVMWRWQMLRDSSFTQILKARALYPKKTILQSYEMNVPGHEHGSMGLIANQFLAIPNCNPIAEFEFKFDGSDADITGGVAQGWVKSALSGHAKTLEALAWLQKNYPTSSYLVPAHPERKPAASGYSIASFRDMNNTAPSVCFGFESMPGHQKDPGGRGGYTSTAQGGGTYGGTGYFSAIVGGMWDAMLSEGRNFWLFANSDCHDEAGDFYPGEYQKNYTLCKDKTAQSIVDGLRSGNTWVVQGDLIDSLIYKIETIGTEKISAVMGSNMLIEKGKSVKITIKARDPQGINNNTYGAYNNPVLNHIDLIKGKIGPKIQSTDSRYNVDKVTTTSVIARFDAVGGVTDSKNIVSAKWTSSSNGWVEMSLTIPNVTDSVYFRLRGSNLGLNVTNETDADGNPLADALVGTNDAIKAFADIWFYSNPIFVYSVPTKTASNTQIQMIYTSDSHYGITRADFQGAKTVNAQVVNSALVTKINQMPTAQFPNDKGVNAGQTIGTIDYVINTGDMANRQETGIQSDATSWAQFATDYITGITLKNRLDKKTPLLLLPGNHDVSNAIGYYKTMVPAIDKTSMVNIYNLMMTPATPKDASSYDFKTDKINYSRNIGGIHFMFITMWPDSANRIWMANDLSKVSLTTPVVIFAHDQPDIETKHLYNPNGAGTINSTDKFENMVEEKCKDGKTVSASSNIEQRGFASFVKTHPNIKAYFHGNSNWNQFYVYNGPDKNIALRTIRVDSPMKGEPSATQEKILSYQVISLDTISKNMTVRECLWNPTATKDAPVQWGASISFALNKTDSLTNIVNSLVESNYTIPSWTLLKRAMTTAAVKDSASTSQLQIALNGLKAKEMPYTISMSFNGDPTSQLGFAWFNNAGVTGEKVEIVAGTATNYFAFATPKFSVDATSSALTDVNYCVSGNNLLALAGFANNSKRSYVSNKALVKGLTPNTTYSFRIGKPGAWSEIGTFTTAKTNKDTFSFVYTTDPQANTVDMFDISQKTTHAAQAMYPNTNFWLNCGDLVETSGSTNSEWEYEQFFQTQQDIFLKNPLVSVTGNHDKTANKNFTNHFNTESVPFDQAKSTTPGSNYSFVYGDALFLAISYEDYSVTGYLDDLTTWMRAQVAAHPEVKWRIAFYHKTMYTGSGSHQSDADGKVIRDVMTPIFDELKIDLAMQGHDHIYEVIGPLKGKALVAGAVTNQITVAFDARANVNGKSGGTFDVKNGTLYFLNNSAGKKKYEPHTQAQMTAVEAGLGLTNYFGMFSGRFGQTGNPTYSNVSVSTDAIDVNTFEVNDLGVTTPFDSFKIVKSSWTGIDKNRSTDQNAISMYPVPVKDYAYVTFANPAKATLNVYNVTGTLVKSQQIDGSTQIDLSQLSSGVYVLEVKSVLANYTVKFTKE